MQDSARLFFYTQVMKNYSDNLINEAKKYFSDLFNRPIDEEEVELFLKLLTNLYDYLKEE